MQLAINRCPTHGYWMVAIERKGYGGTRITPSKCCGSWEVVKTWELSVRDWEELANLAQQAAEQ